MLISWIGTQIQIRMGIGSRTFYARGTMRGQICIPYAKVVKFYNVNFIQLLFAATQSLISLK